MTSVETKKAVFVENTAMKTKELKLVTYTRVSTSRQGESKLGLEAQDMALKTYSTQNDGRIIAKYVEVESGKDDERPELAKALAHAKRCGARLCFAKLDRLARHAWFLLGLVESGADVVFCDFPNIPPGAMGKYILTQMAALAELEAGQISERTTAALAAAKARGVLLGSARPGHWDGREELRIAGAKKGAIAAAKVHAEEAKKAYADILPMMQEYRAGGMTLQAIADKLTADGHTTRRGKVWSPTQVKLVLDRAG